VHPASPEPHLEPLDGTRKRKRPSGPIHVFWDNRTWILMECNCKDKTKHDVIFGEPSWDRGPRRAWLDFKWRTEEHSQSRGRAVHTRGRSQEYGSTDMSFLTFEVWFYGIWYLPSIFSGTLHVLGVLMQSTFYLALYLVYPHVLRPPKRFVGGERIGTSLDIVFGIIA